MSRCCVCGEERLLPADFLGLGDDMGQIPLKAGPVLPDTVIGGIPVAHQCAVEVFSEKGFGYLGRPMPVDMVWLGPDLSRMSQRGPPLFLFPRGRLGFLAILHVFLLCRKSPESPTAPRTTSEKKPSTPWNGFLATRMLLAWILRLPRLHRLPERRGPPKAQGVVRPPRFPFFPATGNV